MLSVFQSARKALGRVLIGSLALFAAACVPSDQGGGRPGKSDGSKSVQVALLVPGGSGQASDQILADSLTNAARLAIADLNGAKIDLRVYQTAGSPAQAAAMAQKAVAEGASVILGPVYAQEANAAGVAVKGQGVNVMAFSNNRDIAGGNVFVLGPTFDNAARRMAGYAVGQGRGRVMIVHERNQAGETGKAAIQRGVSAAGGTVVAVNSYEFSQNGVASAAPGIVQTARESGASALFLTADTAGALPMLSQLLVDNGLDRNTSKMLGLTRWDVPRETLNLPSVQGGWFTLPDPNLYAQFQSRYSASYGRAPHPIAGLAYDGIAAIGALTRSGNDLSVGSLTQNAGFVGVSGIFRFRGDGSNQRGLAIAEIRNNQVVVIDSAPRSFSGAGL